VTRTRWSSTTARPGGNGVSNRPGPALKSIHPHGATEGAAMTGTDIAMAVVFFVAGIATGVIVLASIGILREERVFLRTGLVSLTRRAPGRVSNSARSLTGLYVGQRTD